MDDFGLSSIHNWLWAELDNLGIDSVIYSRHILDLFISSKYSTDFYLAKKEKSIFDHIDPTCRKRKHRYTRRSNSFSNTGTEEVAWKKQIAISCLKSAVDSSETNTMKSIQRLVDEIYTKLNDLRLNPDTLQKESQSSNLLAVKQKEPKTKSNKENYDQAFPTLSPTNMKTQPNISDEKNSLLWPKLTKFNDSQIRSLSEPTTHLDTSQNSPSPTCRNENKKFIRKPNLSSQNKPLKEKSRSTCNAKVSRTNPYKYQRNSRRKPSTHYPQPQDRNQKHAAKNVKGRCKVQTKSKVKGRTLLPPPTYPEFGKRIIIGHHLNATKRETTSRYKFARCNNDTLITSVDEASKIQSAALQSKWFRDPETGLLTFEPGNAGSIDNELDQLEVPRDSKCTESWMWCPSPSFWTEDSTKLMGSSKSSSTSRLLSVYQHSDESDQAPVDAITGKFWRQYQGIFSNLDDDNDSRVEDEDNDSVFNDVSNDSLFLSEDSTDYLLVGFSVGLNIFSDDSPSEEQQCVGGKSKFADFFSNSDVHENVTKSDPWNKQIGEKDTDASVSIWDSSKNSDSSSDFDGGFSEETLEILLNPGNFYSFTSDLNTYLFSGCLNWLNVSSHPQDYHMYNQNHFNLEMGCGSSKFEKYFQSNSLEPRNWKREDLPFIEAVTNNDAWKTSLRIGNVWQSISGIRPVVVIYNERMKPPEEQSVVPTDMTHFRPIHKSETASSSKFEQQEIKTTECCKTINQEIGVRSSEVVDMNYSINPDDDNIEDEFKPKFKKLGQDKSMQTTFEKDFQKLIHDRQNLRQ